MAMRKFMDEAWKFFGDMSGVEEAVAAAAALQRRRLWWHRVFDAHRCRLPSSASVDEDDDEDDDKDDFSENTVKEDGDVAETENWKFMLYRFLVFSKTHRFTRTYSAARVPGFC